MSYADYLHSPWWRCRRYQAFEEAGWRCERCGRRGLKHPYIRFGYGLDVHHLSYERLGHEQKEDLEVVCRPCHANIHGIPVEIGFRSP